MSDLAYNTQPLVTVAMPIYNAGKYLRLAVVSILNQTYPNWELIIIDDGSTDNALESIADIRDARIHIHRDGQNKGLASRLNECIDLARGNYIARMDQDDVSYPERFTRQVEFLQRHTEIDLVATRAITIDEQNQISGLFPFRSNHEDISAQPWRGFYFPHPTWMGRIEWFHRHRYATPAPYFCEDQELLLRSYQESQFATIDKILFAYRIRRVVNWHKQIRTQRTVLTMQLRCFIKQHQYHFGVFSLLVFMGRFSNTMFSQAFYPFLKNKTVVASVLSKEWEDQLLVLLETRR